MSIVRDTIRYAFLHQVFRFVVVLGIGATIVLLFTSCASAPQIVQTCKHWGFKQGVAFEGGVHTFPDVSVCNKEAQQAAIEYCSDKMGFQSAEWKTYFPTNFTGDPTVKIWVTCKLPDQS